ncbi:MAG: EcsC family protein [Desulfosarcinaceae bacterium]
MDARQHGQGPGEPGMLNDFEKEELRFAKQLLESPSLASKLTAMLGTSLEKGFDLLPDRWAAGAGKVAAYSLEKALRVALYSMKSPSRRRPADRLHKWMAASSGGLGGAFGLPALALELPVTTTIMLRAIADIARSQGEDIASAEAKLACLQVFALGGASVEDDGLNAGYFALRTLLAKNLSDAARFLAAKGLSGDSAPVLVRFIGQIAARFGIIISEKAAAQALPVVGAAGGAAINTLFMKHYQDMARGHFIVRRLERRYGGGLIQAVYKDL